MLRRLATTASPHFRKTVGAPSRFVLPVSQKRFYAGGGGGEEEEEHDLVSVVPEKYENLFYATFGLATVAFAYFLASEDVLVAAKRDLEKHQKMPGSIANPAKGESNKPEVTEEDRDIQKIQEAEYAEHQAKAKAH
ncbi:hypothetical protein AKO1_004546 [Acrasis kona]|uniref:Uncharacterized protein n=1 Tax=Acrasis kona TaxID=1008807 RepID=A0AAW2Z4Q6_9EUKA